MQCGQGLPHSKCYKYKSPESLSRKQKEITDSLCATLLVVEGHNHKPTPLCKNAALSDTQTLSDSQLKDPSVSFIQLVFIICGQDGVVSNPTFMGLNAHSRT